MLPNDECCLMCRNSYFINNWKLVFLFIFSVSISLILNSFYNTALFDKKKVSLFNLFRIRSENQSASLP